MSSVMVTPVMARVVMVLYDDGKTVFSFHSEVMMSDASEDFGNSELITGI